MTPLQNQPTHIKVRTILGVPPRGEDSFYETLTDSQRIGLAISWVAEDQEDLRQRGCALHPALCSRVSTLERWITWGKGGVMFLGAAAAIIFFVFAAIEWVKRY